MKSSSPSSSIQRASNNSGEFTANFLRFTLTNVSTMSQHWTLRPGTNFLGRDDAHHRPPTNHETVLTFDTPNTAVSRNHAIIEIHPNGDAWIRDLGSVNGTKVIQPRPEWLQSSDIMRNLTYTSPVIEQSRKLEPFYNSRFPNPNKNMANDNSNSNSASNNNNHNIDSNKSTMDQAWYQLLPNSIIALSDVVLWFRREPIAERVIDEITTNQTRSNNIPSQSATNNNNNNSSSSASFDYIPSNNQLFGGGSNNSNTTAFSFAALSSSNNEDAAQLKKQEKLKRQQEEKEQRQQQQKQQRLEEEEEQKRQQAMMNAGSAGPPSAAKNKSPQHIVAVNAAVSSNAPLPAGATGTGSRIRSRHQMNLADTENNSVPASTKAKQQQQQPEDDENEKQQAEEEEKKTGPKKPANSAAATSKKPAPKKKGAAAAATTTTTTASKKAAAAAAAAVAEDEAVEEEEDEKEDKKQKETKAPQSKAVTAAKNANNKKNAQQQNTEDAAEQQQPPEQEQQPTTAAEARTRLTTLLKSTTDPKVADLEDNLTITTMPKPRNVIFTGYTSTEKQNIRGQIKKFGCTIKEEWDDDVNMLICKTPADRTPKLMMSVGRGIPIVTVDFFAASGKKTLKSCVPEVVAQEKKGKPEITLKPAEVLSILRRNQAFGPALADRQVSCADVPTKELKEQVHQVVTACGGKVFKTANQLATALGKQKHPGAIERLNEKKTDDFYARLLTNPASSTS